MNLRQAHYIRTIASEGSMTTAARKLYVSQPSLSQMVRQLEQELGVTLFDRSTQPLKLTYAGERCLKYAVTILNAEQQLLDEMQQIRNEQSGVLRLGISVQRGMQVLAPILPRFNAEYPLVKIKLTEVGSARLESLLLDNEIDLALAATESSDPRITYRLLENEQIGILTGKNAALVSRIPDGTPVSLFDIGDDPFVCLREGHSLRVVQDQLFRQNGLSPKILLETNSLEVAKRTALFTGALMLCSNIYVDEMVRLHGAFYPLKDYVNTRHFYACTRAGESIPGFAEALIRIVIQYLRENLTA